MLDSATRPNGDKTINSYALKTLTAIAKTEKLAKT